MKKKELKRLILKYETMLDTLIVMDDYDGGEAKMLRTILKDLKEIEATASLDEHIQKVRAEVNSGYNDGYMKEGFQEKLEEMKKYPHQDNHMD